MAGIMSAPSCKHRYARKVVDLTGTIEADRDARIEMGNIV
jgi:hypothetical protein